MLSVTDNAKPLCLPKSTTSQRRRRWLFLLESSLPSSASKRRRYAAHRSAVFPLNRLTCAWCEPWPPRRRRHPSRQPPRLGSHAASWSLGQCPPRCRTWWVSRWFLARRLLSAFGPTSRNTTFRYAKIISISLYIYVKWFVFSIFIVESLGLIQNIFFLIAYWFKETASEYLDKVLLWYCSAPLNLV